MISSLDIENAEALQQYLRASGRIGTRERVRLSILRGGISNRTVLVERTSGADLVLKQALSKLRVKGDWFADPNRIHREAQALIWLPRVAPAGTITPLFFEDADQHLIAMAAVPRPHRVWKQMLMEGDIDPGQFRFFGELLGTIHRRSQIESSEISEIFGDRSFFESLRIRPYYEQSAKNVPEAARFIGELIAATHKRQLCLVHGDFSPKNVLVMPQGMVLLDHEVVHFGDPAFDVGFALTHFLSKAHHLPDYRPQFLIGARQFLQSYLDLLSDSPVREGLEDSCVKHGLACLLARVSGKSPLEYLTAAEQKRQRDIVVAMMRRPPNLLDDLVEQFSSSL